MRIISIMKNGKNMVKYLYGDNQGKNPPAHGQSFGRGRRAESLVGKDNNGAARCGAGRLARKALGWRKICQC